MSTNHPPSAINRRRLLQTLAALGTTGPAAAALVAQSRGRASIDVLRSAAAIRGEAFTDARLRVIEAALQRNLDQFQIVRDLDVGDLVEPAPVFTAKRR